MRLFLHIAATMLSVLCAGCDKPEASDSSSDLAPVEYPTPKPQKHVLEIVFESRPFVSTRVYAWDVSVMQKMKEEDVTGIPLASETLSDDYVPLAQHFENLEYFDLSAHYDTKETVVGLFYGQSYKDSKHILSPTSLPLAFMDQAVWGFETEEDHERGKAVLEKYLERVDEKIWVADFTYSRLQESHYWVLSSLNHLKSLTLPIHGVDFSSDELSFPGSLERLVIHNTRIDRHFGEKIRHLKSLKELVFVGCWLDTYATQPHWGNDSFDEHNAPIRSALGKEVHPYDNIHLSLQTLKFVDCGMRLIMATDYYTWPNLEYLEVHDRLGHISDDGLPGVMHYLKIKPPNSRNFSNNDYFHALASFTLSRPEFGEPLPERYIKKLEQLIRQEQMDYSELRKDPSMWTWADNEEIQMRHSMKRRNPEFKFEIIHNRREVLAGPNPGEE